MIKNVPIILNLQFYIIIAFYFSAVLALHTTLSTTRYPLIRWGEGRVLLDVESNPLTFTGQQSVSSLRMSSSSSRMSPTPSSASSCSAYDHHHPSMAGGCSSTGGGGGGGGVSSVNAASGGCSSGGGGNSSSHHGPANSGQTTDRQLAIVTSEKQARVILLPSQVCAYRVKITDTSQVIAADVLPLKGLVLLSLTY